MANRAERKSHALVGIDGEEENIEIGLLIYSEEEEKEVEIEII